MGRETPTVEVPKKCLESQLPATMAYNQPRNGLLWGMVAGYLGQLGIPAVAFLSGPASLFK